MSKKTKKRVFLNQKGGVGKTASAVNVAAGLAKKGKKVLLVDCDPQGNTTKHLGFNPKTITPSLYEVYREQCTVEEAIINCQKGLDLLPARDDLSASDVDLVNEIGGEFVLKNRLEGLEGYDYILLDTASNLGLLTINTLTFADEVYIPLQVEFLAMDGMSQLMKTVNLVQSRLNPDLGIAGIILTMYSKTNHADGIIAEVQEVFDKLVFKTIIRRNVRLAEAPGFGQTIFDYDKKCNGSIDYMNLTKEIIKNG